MSAAHSSCAVLFWDSSLRNQWFVTLLTFSGAVKLTQGLDPSDSIVAISYCLPGGEGDILFCLTLLQQEEDEQEEEDNKL